MNDGQEEIWRGGQVEDAIALGAALGVDLAQPLAQPAVRFRIGKVALHVAQSLGESLPGILGDRGARAGGDRLAHLFAELLVAPIAMRDPDDREALGEGLTDGQVIERRHELARGEIAADAEDDHRRRSDDAVDLGRAERIQRFLGLGPGVDRMRPDLGWDGKRQVGRIQNGARCAVVGGRERRRGRGFCHCEIRASQDSLHRRLFPLPGVPVPPPRR